MGRDAVPWSPSELSSDQVRAGAQGLVGMPMAGGSLIAPDGSTVMRSALIVVGDDAIKLESNGNEVLSLAGGPTSLVLSVPAAPVFGTFNVINGDGKSDTAVYLQHAVNSLRMANSGSSVIIPNVTLAATAVTLGATDGWSIGLMLRVHEVNTKTGTVHYALLKMGTAPSYFLLAYEGPNAANPGCLKLIYPDAAGTGITSLRSNASPAPVFAPFGANMIGKDIWVFVRRHSAASVEPFRSIASPTGAETSATFTVGTITLAYCEALAPTAAGVQVFAGSAGIAVAAQSAVTNSLRVGPEASDTGICDFRKLFKVNQTLTQAQMREVAKGKLPRDVGVTVNNATDFYYDLTSLTAAELLDLFGGTAATSVTMAGADGLTPAANRATTLQYIDNTGPGWLAGTFADSQGRKLGAQA